MSTSETDAALFCPGCGKGAEGNFCKYCGTQLASVEREDWAGVVAEVAGTDDRYGVLQVLWRLWRAPVDSIIRLTEDPNYKGHFTFFLTLLGAKLFLQFGLIPRFVAVMGGAPDTDSAAHIAKENILQYASLLIFLPLGYIIYRWVSKVQRTQRAYYKFSLIGSGFLFSLEFFATLAVIAIGTVMAFVCTFFLPPSAWTFLQANNVFPIIYGVMVIVGTLWFYCASTRTFWSLSWPAAIGITVLVLVITLPIYMALGAIVDASGIVKLIV